MCKATLSNICDIKLNQVTPCNVTRFLAAIANPTQSTVKSAAFSSLLVKKIYATNTIMCTV